MSQFRPTVQNKRTGSAASLGSIGGAGSISDEQFRAAFEAIPDLHIHTVKELLNECQKNAAILENSDNDWHVRVKTLGNLRALLKNDVDDFHLFMEQSPTLLTQALTTSVKDLRSQVCREACITIAYYSMKLGTEFWRIAEAVLPVTISLCQNSAKIMATSAYNVNIYIAKYVHHTRVLTLILQNLSHKAKEVRRMVIALISTIIKLWHQQNLEKHWTEIINCVKSCLSDADCDTRAIARQAYENLQSAYPQVAEALYQQLEPAKQRMLAGSTASSTHSINSERDNLPTPGHGLYGLQNAFLSDRSKSDMNYAFRRLNIAQKVSHRPNIPSGKPPQATTRQNSFTPIAPNIKKATPMIGTTNTANKLPSPTPANSKPNSQPGSRSNSPARRVRPIIATSTEKKQQYSVPNNTPVRHVANLGTRPRGIRPNVVRTVTNTNGGAHVALELTPGASPTDFYGLSHNQEVLLRINNSTQSGSGKKTEHQQRTSLESQNKTVNKWEKLSPNSSSKNEGQQAVVLTEICDLLKNSDHTSDNNDKNFQHALDTLTLLIRDGGITLWEEYFHKILHAILNVVSRASNHSRIKALRALKELCIKQPDRIMGKSELVLLKILNAQENDDASIGRIAEECGNTLISILPTNNCLQLLLSIVDDENSKSYQLSGAIKILSHMISNLPSEEVLALLDLLVPRMTKCYENTQSMVRRSSIICLVAISNSIGTEHLKSYLNPATMKLVDVYRDRMMTKKASL